MMDTGMKMMVDKALTWAKEAGEIASASFLSSINIEVKTTASDLVTNIDKEIEIFLKDKVNEFFPEHQVIGEEGTGHELENLSGYVWIIDPIDGTLNFIHQQREFAVSIGIYENGIGKVGIIYDVVRDEIYHAVEGEGAYMNGRRLERLSPLPLESSLVAVNASWVVSGSSLLRRGILNVLENARGTRSIGSAALEIAGVAAGRLDAYLSMQLSPWDYAGGAVLMKELGGVVSKLDGEELTYRGASSFIACRPELYDEIIQSFQTKKNP